MLAMKRVCSPPFIAVQAIFSDTEICLHPNNTFDMLCCSNMKEMGHVVSKNECNCCFIWGKNILRISLLWPLFLYFVHQTATQASCCTVSRAVQNVCANKLWQEANNQKPQRVSSTILSELTQRRSYPIPSFKSCYPLSIQRSNKDSEILVVHCD